jgi:hypothetical protein
MRAAFLTPRHQPGALQRLFYPRIAQLDGVLFAQLLVEMPHTQVTVGVAVQRQHTLGGLHRHAQIGPLPPPLVKQSVVAEFLIPFSHPPYRPVAHADDLGRLQPGDLLRHGS